MIEVDQREHGKVFLIKTSCLKCPLRKKTNTYIKEDDSDPPGDKIMDI
jgi:hypothetical protein